MNMPARITLRPTVRDDAILDEIHLYLRNTRPRQFISRSETLRFALRTCEKAIRNGTAG